MGALRGEFFATKFKNAPYGAFSAEVSRKNEKILRTARNVPPDPRPPAIAGPNHERRTTHHEHRRQSTFSFRRKIVSPFVT